jgi:hypothetical protein
LISFLFITLIAQIQKLARNGTEAIPKYAIREHHIKQYIGDGEQTFRWLVLAARERLLAMYNVNKGKLRSRERMVGIPGAFIPNKIRSEDPETDDELLKGSVILNTIVKDGDTIWIEFNQDGGRVTKWENETFYQTKGENFVEARDTYELVEDALEAEPEVSDADFYGKVNEAKPVVKKEVRRKFNLYL